MLSFLSMSTGPQTDLKILATGLGAGILIDAVIIRCLLVPALVALFGRANWSLPERLAGLLRVRQRPTDVVPGADRRPVGGLHRNRVPGRFSSLAPVSRIAVTATAP
jgi:MMPL family